MTDITYDVPLILQPDKLSCWCASMAMLVSFRRQASYPPEQLAQDAGCSLRTSYGWDTLEAVKVKLGFQDIALPSNATLYPSPQQCCDWLTTYGPLWITVVGAPSHAIILRGLSSDLTPDGTASQINNPWDTSTSFSSDPIDFSPVNNGRAYNETFTQLASDFGNMSLANYGDWRVLYLPASSQ